MHAINRDRARAWFRGSGLKSVKIVDAMPPNWRRIVALSRGLASPLFSFEYIVAGQRVDLEGDRDPEGKASELASSRQG